MEEEKSEPCPVGVFYMMLPGRSVPRGLGSVVLGPGHIATAVVPRVGRGGAHGGGPGQALVATAMVA